MIKHSSPNIDAQDIQAVLDQISSGSIAYGEKVCRFEDELKKLLEVSHLYTCANGSLALYISLKALTLPNQSEVILPSYVCHNVYDAVLHAGLNPVLCDIGDCWAMTPDSVECVITKNTSAIIVVHPLGMTVNTKAFRKFGIAIIEDFAQNFAGVKDGNLTEHHGDLGVYSFHATKCLTTGEGGALATNNKKLNDAILELLKNKSIHNPMTDIQAALGIAQLGKYPELLAKRRSIAEAYFSGIRKDLTDKFYQVKKDSIFFRFLLWKENVNFEKIKNDFENQGIAIRKGVDNLQHQRLGLGSRKAYANTEETFQNTISIPMLPHLSEGEQDKIIKAVNSLL